MGRGSAPVTLAAAPFEPSQGALPRRDQAEAETETTRSDRMIEWRAIPPPSGCFLSSDSRREPSTFERRLVTATGSMRQRLGRDASGPGAYGVPALRHFLAVLGCRLNPPERIARNLPSRDDEGAPPVTLGALARKDPPCRRSTCSHGPAHKDVPARRPGARVRMGTS